MEEEKQIPLESEIKKSDSNISEIKEDQKNQPSEPIKDNINSNNSNSNNKETKNSIDNTDSKSFNSENEYKDLRAQNLPNNNKDKEKIILESSQKPFDRESISSEDFNQNLNIEHPNSSHSQNSDDNNNSDNEKKYDITVLSEDYLNYDISFKIIVIGDSGVGKSCLTNSAVREKFETSYQATVGFEFSPMFIKINNKVVKLQIWDTCGQEIYRSLVKNFYRHASLAFMVYSIDNEESFNDIDFFMKEVKNCAGPDSKLILIGNKNDLEEERKVTYEMGANYAKNYGFEKFYETSAKTGFNAKNAFIEAAKILYEDFQKYGDLSSRKSSDAFSESKESESSISVLVKNKKRKGNFGNCSCFDNSNKKGNKRRKL